MNASNQQISEALNSRRQELAAQMVEREFARRPELEPRYGKSVRGRMLEDTGYHVAYLAQALEAENAEPFVNYIAWAKVVLAKRGVPATYVATLLESMKETVVAQLLPEHSGPACAYLNVAAQRLPELPDEVPTFIVQGTPHAQLATQYLQTLLRGERHLASKLILDAAEQGTPVRELYLQVFQRTQREIGRLWQMNQISVAQEHYCTAATQLIMSQLYPYIFGAEKKRGTLVATCVSGDLHEIGARMVCDFFELDGWNTYYLGANVPTQSVVQTVVQFQATVLAISATITFHVHEVEALIAAVRGTPACTGVKIIVGGYPFRMTPDLWKSVGADGSANDAEEALTLANQLTTQALAA